MRLQLKLCALWLLPLLLAGCSTTAGSRFGGTPQSRSIAVVGDRPLPASTGEPGGRVVADAEEPEPKLNARRRISGRVVDEAGEPVAGAIVRLADGGVKGGKEIQATTDRSGAFTLNGLRPGSSYVLIAEGEDAKGPIQGRVEANTADTGVEIALVSDEKKPTARKTARPSKAKPISNREDVEAEPVGEDAPKVNREDVAPPAREADELDSGPPQPKRAGRPQLSAPEPGVGWKNPRSATASRPKNDHDDDSATADVPAKPRKPTKRPAPAPTEDEANPLPPALEPGAAEGQDEPTQPGSARFSGSNKVGARAPQETRPSGELALVEDASVEAEAKPESARKPGKSESYPPLEGEFRNMSALLPELGKVPSIPAKPAEVVDARPTPEPVTTASTTVDTEEPPSLPPIGGGPVKVATHEAPSPTTSPPDPPKAIQDVPHSNPASQPVFASNAPAPAPDYNPFANLQPAHIPIDKVVANPPLAAQESADATPPPSPAAEAPKKKWGELAAIDRPQAAVQPTRLTLTGALLRRRKPMPEAPKDQPIAACVYDTRLRKINDLRLPDLEGKPVRFQDLDADFVLLDFWGTWCEPCLDSIPHLVELQKKYGPSRLKVVGIACEEVPPDQRRAKIDEVSRKFGINYPILLSTMDGKPCPVQQALQVQAMPTMVLVDRKGQVLWRNTGSTPASESRLDRILALNLNRSVAASR